MLTITIEFTADLAPLPRPAMLIRDDDPEAPAAAVVRRFALAEPAELFARCCLCNGRVRPVAKASVAARIPPRTALWLDEFNGCADCGQPYWEGTHVAVLRAQLERILAGGD